jgi:hypothetical protein
MVSESVFSAAASEVEVVISYDEKTMGTSDE